MQQLKNHTQKKEREGERTSRNKNSGKKAKTRKKQSTEKPKRVNDEAAN